MVNKLKYVTGELVQFFPHDNVKKYGYIRDVDDYGFTYEVTECRDKNEIGIFFRSHSLGLTWKQAPAQTATVPDVLIK